MPSPLILVGPTTAGKSDVATAIADVTEGTIITADRGYMYAKPDLLWIGLGLTPGELDDGRRRRLFGSLEPHDSPLSPTEFIEQVKFEVETIHAAGGLAIVEGCTRRYNTALMDEFGLDNTVGIFWSSEETLHGKLTRRVQKSVEWGMYEEIEAALAAGYGESHPMTTVPYIQSRRVLDGLAERSVAEATIADQLTQISIEHQESYAAMNGLRSLVHERGRTKEIASTALAMMGTSNNRAGQLVKLT